MNKIVLLFFLLITFTSCNKYKIEGSTADSGLDGRMFFVKVLGDDREWHTIDSCEVVHGEFTMEGNVDSVVMATLFMDNNGILPLVIEKGKLKVKINESDIKVSGTPMNDSLYEFMNKQNSINTQFNDLLHKESQMILNGEDPDVAHEMLNREGEKLSKEMSDLTVNFITGNFDNVLGRGVFLIMINNMPYPLITPEITRIMDKAPDSFKEYPLIKEYMSAAHENMNRARQQY